MTIDDEKKRIGKDREYLAKDKWSFTDVQPSLQEGEQDIKKELQDTRLENAIDMSVDVGSKAPSIKHDKTIIGIPNLSPTNLTSPLILSKRPSTEAYVRIENKEDALLLPRAEEGVKRTASDVKTAHLEHKVMVESISKKLKATAPMEIATPVSAGSFSEADSQEKKEPNLKSTTGAMNRPSDVQPRHFYAMAAALILLATWFIPNVITDSLIFQIDLVKVLRGVDLAVLVAPPFAGAVALMLQILPMNTLGRAAANALIGLATLIMVLILGNPALPLTGSICFFIVLAATGASIIIKAKASRALLGTLSLAFVPAAFLAVAVFGIATYRLPLANVTVLKDPLIVYAGMLLIAGATNEVAHRFAANSATPH